MPSTLIVLAHPEPRSFNAQWAQASADASAALGHDVIWSDLYALGFDPAERAAHYDHPADLPFDALKAQGHAAETVLPADVAAELDKLRRADRIIFHFPMWWFAPPAMLKGWCDRALAHGALHSTAERFDTGMLRGKKALLCVTTGSSADESAHNGKEGDVNLLLWPLAYTLRYLGLTILQPVCVHGVHGYHRGARATALAERLGNALAGQAGLIAGFDDLPEITFNADDGFDAKGRLRADRPSVTPFIRHHP
ncbi:NAD(P)H-dependent oxidoreductase [Yoonia vestfoldensis]|uniref:General stress protein 14 n=1 Tax=Yoonia vestfoldensis TaxID=245188 RepID=A0A1Y0EFG0_9RHOB|nr:NAD(P)H-dependent oxidoreductase [Yoonia vestfoldensis]ARU02158.1 general stress protein 14 [Yoonia vestfoldensis]